MKNYELKIFLDLDGVLANFSGKIEEITGHSIEQVSRGYLWASVQKYNDTIGPFFESLEKMPNADELWNFATTNFGHVSILTASGYTPKDGAAQKINWVKANFGSQVNVKVVSSASLKAMYANPASILIDDTVRAIDPWIRAGGIGVLHKNTKDSILQLQEILN